MHQQSSESSARRCASINEETIRKLNHDIPEIRLRALQSIEEKLFQADVFVNPANRTLLLKSLFRWFGFKPCIQPDRTLVLIRRLLEEPNAHESIAVLGRERILKDLNKIEKLLTSFDAMAALQHARTLVRSSSPARTPLQTISNPSQSSLSSNNMSSVSIKLNLTPSLAELHLDADELAQTARLSYEVAWQQPAIADLKSMRLLNSAVRDVDSRAGFEHAVRFLGNACDDLPGEYFLQPPYIALNLQSLLARDTSHSGRIVQNCTNISRSLRKRILQRQLNDTRVSEPIVDTTATRSQITLPSYLVDSLRCALDHLKFLIDRRCDDHEINQTFDWLSSLLDTADVCTEATNTIGDGILPDVGYLARYFRQTRDDLNDVEGVSFGRRTYIQLINLMCRLMTTLSTRPDGLCLEELQFAVLDYPFGVHFADLWSEVGGLVKNFSNSDEDKAAVLFRAGDIFKPAIEMLRSDQTDDPLLATSLAAIDTLSLHQSLPLVKRIFGRLLRAQPQFESTAALRENAENILLRLLAHDNPEVHRLVYGLCAEQMKLFFASLMDGSAMPRGKQPERRQGVWLGVPLTADILVEMICFGLTNADVKIHDHASAMLLLVLRSRNLLAPAAWSSVLALLLVAMPLLQAACSQTSPLCDEILIFLNPDHAAALHSPLAILVGNLRLLFHPTASVRDEAIARLLYHLVSQPDAAQYLPNVANITDLIPNDLCVCAIPWDAQAAADAPPLYDATTLDSLIALLGSSAGVEPAVRRSTLLQLGCLLVDPALCARFEQQAGLSLTATALRNACSESHHTDYPDAAIAAVAVLAKLCANSASVRRQLATDETTLRCVLRALLLFFKNDGMRRDCAIVLFLVTHSGYVTGAGRVSVPVVVQRLHVPLVHEAHWQQSPFVRQSELERIVLEADPGGVEWQYVRFAFAREYLPNVLNELPKSEKEVKYPGLAFNDALRLNVADRRLMHSTDMNAALACCTHRISNATTHSDVLQALASISAITTIIDASDQQSIAKELIATLRRFFAVPPNTEPDFRCFEAILTTVRRLIEHGAFDAMLVWMLEQMRRKSCPLMAMLRSSETDKHTFRTVCDFLRHVWRVSMRKRTTEGDDGVFCGQLLEGKLEGFGSLVEYYYETVVGMLDELFEKRELDKLRALLAFLSCLTATENRPHFPLDAEAAAHLANKLLRFVATIRMLAQTGAAFNRNCLRTVANVLHTASHHRQTSSRVDNVDVFALRNKYVRLLSGLCGHADIEVRTLAWCVLAECVRSYAGAVQLVKELAYLPGGFHACCLSTFLDPHECSVVRSTAGTVFAELLRHIDGRHQRILLPLYGTGIASSTRSEDSNDGNSNRKTQPPPTTTLTTTVEQCVDTVCELLVCHRFAGTMSVQLDDFWATDQPIDDNENNDGSQNRPPTAYTSWCVVRTFCTIAMQLVRLRAARAVRDLHDNRLVLGVARLLPTVQQQRSRRAVQMMAAVCRFVSACVRCSDALLDVLAADEPAVVAAMVACMEPAFYDGLPVGLRSEALAALVALFGQLATRRLVVVPNPDGTDGRSGRIVTLVHLVEFALDAKRQEEELCALVLGMLRNLLQCDVQDDGGQMFGDMLDTVLMESGELAATICFRRLHDLLNRSRESALLPDIAATIALLLQRSHHARLGAAHPANLLADLLDSIDTVLGRLDGVTCSEFLRRFGEAKKEPIVAALRLNTTILLHWFSRACLHCDDVATPAHSFTADRLRRLVTTAVRLWPWAGTDARLQRCLLAMLAHASEDSLPVCKLFAQQRLATTGSTVLQLCAEHVRIETQRAQRPGATLETLELAMRIVSNCCACIESRQALHKMAFLDAMDRLHPSVTKHQRPWPAVTRVWLGYYEILTRYADTNSTGVKHLSLLCTLILKPSAVGGALGATLRHQSLTIIRNIAFASVCRPALIASDELLYTFKAVLESDAATAVADQLLVCTAIWRLVANSYKAKHALRAASLPARLGALSDRLLSQRRQTFTVPSTSTADSMVPSTNSELQFTLEALRMLFDK